MKLENQVCNLKLAKELKELGVEQESLFCWLEIIEEPKYTEVISSKLREKYLGPFTKFVNAFTVAELGEMLPDQIDNGFEDPDFIKFDYNVTKNCGYIVFIEDFDFCKKHIEKAETEADARAKMLIYLLENDLIKI